MAVTAAPPAAGASNLEELAERHLRMHFSRMGAHHDSSRAGSPAAARVSGPGASGGGVTTTTSESP